MSKSNLYCILKRSEVKTIREGLREGGREVYKLVQDTVVWRDAELVCQADEHQEGLQLPGGLGG